MRVVITGGAGFIGSCILWKLNQMGIDNILVVDRMDETDKWRNLVRKKYADYMDADDFLQAVEVGALDGSIDMVIHMGANSATTGTDSQEYMYNNYQYTKRLAIYCLDKAIPFLYASSAATYGDGELGFSDRDETTPSYAPLNMYGYSKHMFDLWVLRNNVQDKLIGFKFFNVYGPNEYHKGSMMSLLCKKFDDVVRDKKITLFKSYHPDYADGEQKRDFIYVKDAVDIVSYFVENPHKGGIYNLGTAKAHSWNDLSKALFAALDLPLNIEYVDMPEILKDKYQYFTQADDSKLREAGYTKPFTSIDSAVADYVGYLRDKSIL